MKLLQCFELWQENQEEIFQIDEEIYRRQQNWIANHDETSIRLLEYDENYLKLCRGRKRLEIENRNLVCDIAVCLKEDNLTGKEWEEYKDLLIRSFQCLKQNEIDITAGLCAKLLLNYKKLEEKKRGLLEYGKRGIRCLKRNIFDKELQAIQAKIDKLDSQTKERNQKENRNTIKFLGINCLAYLLGNLEGEHFFSTNSQLTISKFANNINSASLRDWKGNSIDYNQTHSWIEPIFEDASTQFLQNFENEVINQPKNNFDIDGDVDDFLEEEREREDDPSSDYNRQKNMVSLETYNQRPNITLPEYTNLLNDQKPTDLPNNWKDQLAQASKNQNNLDAITNILPELINEAGEFKENQADKILNELKSRPKQTELDQKVKETIAKYKDFIDPTNTTKIIDIAKAEGYQFQQKDIDNAIKTNNQTWIDKGLINPLNPTELEQAQLVPKTKLDQIIAERDNRPNITLDEWENDWSQRPSNKSYTDLEKDRDELKAKIKSAEDFGLTDWDNLKVQTNNETLTTLLSRPTRKELEDYQKTANQTIADKDNEINKLQTDLANWTDTFIGENPDGVIQKLIKFKTDLDDKTKTCNILNQIKIDLELKLSTKSAKIEQLNSLLDTLKRKYGQIRNDKEEAIKAQETAKKERDTALIERDTALLGLENLNQQLDDAQQELVRTQRENRKLTKKLNQQKDQQTKTEQKFQEQSSYLWDIFNCLTSAGIGAKLGWKAGRAYERGELQIKYLKDIQSGIDVLIQQKKEAQQSQQRAEQERDHYRQQVENHHCGSTNSDQSASQTQVKIIQQNNEQAIIQELNTALHLNLNNPTLKQVISEIQSRIAQDPVVIQKGLDQVWQTIQKAEEKLVDQTPFGEDLEVIKDLEIKGLNKLLPNQLEESFIREIKQAQNYSQLVQVRNSFLAKHLAKVQPREIKEVVKEMNQIELAPKQNNQERYIWISLLVVSLIGVGGLLVKLRISSFRLKK